ncbi:MAG: DUF4349 domain-containing protein [Moraxella sp.]|nr:DUF4349 domain-containing protein [Moraxella sp.]
MQKSLTLIICLTLLSACSKPHDGTDYAHQSASSEIATTTDMASVAGANDPNGSNPDNPTLDSQATTQNEQAHLADKAFIIKADVNFAVKDVVATKDQLESLTLQTGGYIQTSKIYNNTTDTHRYPIGGEQLKVLTHFVRHGMMTVRIPRAKVSEFLKGMQGQVVFLNNQEFNASDVALDLQRNALHAQIEAERQAKLGELNATKTDDLADKSTHVGEMTDSKYRQTLAELDRKALAEQVAFSTITLAFYQNPQIFESVMPDTQAYIAKDGRANFGHRFVQSISTGWLYFLEFILWLTSLWAFMVGLAVLIFLWKKVLKKWWNRPFKTPKN